jgi:membrane fusion protein, multidrug efflux system
MDKKTFPLFFTISLVAFSCHSGADKKDLSAKSMNKGLMVQGYIVKPTVLDETIYISGTLKPFEETILMPEVAGRVVKINLQEGKFVKSGILLVKLFDGDLQAQLNKLQAELKVVEQTEKRQSELLKANGISQLDYDQTLLQVNSIHADIEVLKVQINKTELVAPFDGVIGLRNISLGAQVTPSTALATIRAVKQLKLDFSVPEKYSRAIKPGLKVKFTLQGSDKKYDASVMATEEGIEADTRNLKVRSVVDNNGVSLVPGAFANVELQLNENKNALMVPTQAIIPQARSKSLIVSKEGKAKFVVVTTGIRQDSNIEVLNGVSPGDTVLTTGILFIKPGDGVKFSKVIK